MFFSMILKSLFQDLKSTLWSLLTLSGCSTLVALFFLLNSDLHHQISSTFHQMGANGVLLPKGPVGAGDWKKALALAEEEKVSHTEIEIRGARVHKIALPVARVNFAKLQVMTPYWAIQGKRPSKPGECLVGRKVAKRLNLAPGAKIELFWNSDKSITTELTVSGIVDSGDKDENKIFLSHTPSLPPLLTYSPVLGSSTQLKRLSKRLQQARLPFQIRFLGQMFYGEKKILAKISLLSLLSLLTVIILTALGISSIAVARILERKKEFALMQALGAVRKNLIQILLWENGLLGLVASILGFCLGAVLARTLAWQIFHISLSPSWTAFATTFAITLGGALMVGCFAIWRVLSFEPARTLRGE